MGLKTTDVVGECLPEKYSECLLDAQRIVNCVPKTGSSATFVLDEAAIRACLKIHVRANRLVINRIEAM